MIKCIVRIKQNGQKEHIYSGLYGCTMDAAIDAMERYGHAAKISVKRLEEV